MSLRAIFLLSVISVWALPIAGQSVLVCKLESAGTVVRQTEYGNFSTEVVQGQPATLVFANLNTAKPTLKIGTVEVQLELLHADGDTIWLQGFTDEIFGEGIAIWTIDRKAGVVIRSETFRSKEIPSQKWSGRLVGLSSIGKCE
jgi:hypothetical protein